MRSARHQQRCLQGLQQKPGDRVSAEAILQYNLYLSDRVALMSDFLALKEVCEFSNKLYYIISFLY